jgi:hypothetical protein
VLRLEFDRPPSAGARYLGTKVHAGLEAYYQPEAEADPQRAYLAVMQIHHEDTQRVNAWAAERSEGYDPTAKIAELAKETDLALIMLQGYFDWLEETAADALLRPVAAEMELEVPFESNLYGRPWHLVGKLDLQVRREDNGFLAFLDHKTVSNLSDIPKMAAMNEQGLMYNILLRLHGLEHVDGEIVNMLRKVKRTATAKPPFYGRVETRWNSEQLNEFYARITGIVRDIALCEAQLEAGWDHHTVAYPTPTNDCTWDCDFYAVCSMFDDGSRVEDALRAYYRPHDPHARYKVIHADTEEGNE